MQDASWVWCNADWDRVNQYGLFRRRIDLPPEHGRVRVLACADLRYWLYVNGERAGFGPARSDPARPLFDTHDVTRWVRPGRNVIAFKVHAIGPVLRCSSFMPVRPGLIGTVTWDGGSAATDATWAALEETAYAAETPRFANHQSYIECFDARKAALGWERPDFDDSA